MDSRWNHFLHYGNADTKATYGVDGSWRIMERSGLSALSLRHFINAWHEELTDYYGEDFGGEKIIGESDYGDTIIYVLADLRTNIDSTWVPPHIKKKYKTPKKQLENKIKTVKTKYYMELLNKKNRTCKERWDTIREIVSRKRPTQTNCMVQDEPLGQH